MSAGSDPIRVGLIGYGFAGRTFHAPLIHAVPGLELVAVSSRDPARVHADHPRARVFGRPEALAGSDAVDLLVIAAPNDAHAPLAATALDAGHHVVVDKPFTLDLAQARALVAQAERRGRVLSVFQNRRWDSDFLAVRQAVADGRIGRIGHFESHFDRFRPQVRERWRESSQPGAGIWYDLGPHLIDQALCLFGPPRRVQARLAALREGARSDDWAHVLLEYAHCHVLLHASMLVAGGSPRFVVHGDRGSLIKAHIDRQESQLLAGAVPGGDGWGEDPDPLRVLDGEGGEQPLAAPAGDYRRYYAGVRDAIRGLGANPVSPRQAVAVMAVLEAARHADATGRAQEPELGADERAAWC